MVSASSSSPLLHPWPLSLETEDITEDLAEDTRDSVADTIKLATRDSAVDMEASAAVDTREVSVDTREDTMQLSTIKLSTTRDSAVDMEASAVVDTREVS